VGHALTHAESSRYWLMQGLGFWRDEPLGALALTWRKVRLLLGDYEVPDNYAFTCFRSYFTPALCAAPLGWGVLLGLALAGAIRARVELRARPVLLLGALYARASSRSSCSIATGCRLLRCSVCLPRMACCRCPRRARSSPCWLLGTLAAFVPTPVSTQKAWHEAQCVGTAGLELLHDGQDDAARRWLDEATRLAPQAWPAEQQRRLDARTGEP